MKDVFKEQLVRRAPGMKMAVMKAGIVGAAVFLMLLVLMFEILTILLPILWAATIFGAYIAFKRLHVEYEYVLTNSEFDIDIIIGKSRRRRIFNGSVRDFAAFRPVGSAEMESAFGTAVAKMDVTSGRGLGGYEFLANYKGKKMRIVFEPNEDIVEAVLPLLKRGVYPAGMGK
ncbi:MAG: hypothetical protein FWC93_07170 [Defluviitaleaceae bacterium]|nr:hypothetical protein [Defluviitaleaceae bacterium]